MKKTDHPARIVVLRTKPVEALLQEIWAVRPEIRNKISLTVSTAFAALVREGTHTSAIAAPESSIPQQVPVTAPEIEFPVEPVIATPEIEFPVEPVIATPAVSDQESHPDAAWTF